MCHWLLIINSGSTSVKTRLFNAELEAIAFINADYGSNKGFVIEGQDTFKQVIYQAEDNCADIQGILEIIFLRWQQILDVDQKSRLLIGHRIVHGAGWFNELMPVTDDLINKLHQLNPYAPLHNPLNFLGITLASKFFLEIQQFAVFDTAFHRTIPNYAGHYALPEHLSEQIDFYRFGFHGISCQHSVLMAGQMLNKKPSDLNLIILHLGGGASITAIRKGVSVDNSMGFSPTEGLMMATRCGDLDPMILIALQKSGYSVEQLEDIINHQSGLKGVCGEADMRMLLTRVMENESKAQLALDMFCYRVKKYIGAYYAILGEVSALIFTGGIGVYAPLVRSHILQKLQSLGLFFDAEANEKFSALNGDISVSESATRILIIHAEEEREIARQILALKNQ